MFGIGGTELIVIAIVLLIAVGPTRLPTLLKSVVKGYREFRRATRELRSTTGIDEILQDEDLKDLRELRELRKPLYVPPAKSAAGHAKPVAPAKSALSYAERTREAPPEGVDLAEIRDAAERPSPEEAARIKAEKEAIVQAKIAAAHPIDPDEERRIVEAKIAAAEGGGSEAERAAIAAKKAAPQAAPEPLDDADRQRIIESKLAAAEGRGDEEGALDGEALDEEARQRIVDAKLAAAGEE